MLREWLEKNSWDVIPVVCEYITAHTEEAGPHLVQCCQVHNLYIFYFWKLRVFTIASI